MPEIHLLFKEGEEAIHIQKVKKKFRIYMKGSCGHQSDIVFTKKELRIFQNMLKAFLNEDDE